MDIVVSTIDFVSNLMYGMGLYHCIGLYGSSSWCVSLKSDPFVYTYAHLHKINLTPNSASASTTASPTGSLTKTQTAS